ncbi:MAG TPA: hypothetical protein VE863_06180 [Pyrinomonadaceae bacterium]|jgi:hypothetical protein|nr:hypothetical protein [Pyrinomonadaceae bacterium]
MPLSDPLLLPFLAEKDSTKADELLSELVTANAQPIASGIIRIKLRSSLNQNDGRHQNQDALEILNDVRTSLVGQLRALKARQDDKIIADFKGYIAVVTYNACAKRLREKYPRWWRLKNRMRYLLTHSSQFAIWKNERNEWLCGLQSCPADRPRKASREEIEALKSSVASSVSREFITEEHAKEDGPSADLLNTIFQRLNTPVELDDVVNLITDIYGISEKSETGTEEIDQETLMAPGPRVDDELERRQYLERLWAEIGKLPERQRAAILLNLKDSRGNSCVGLFPLTGIATMRQIAGALNIEAGEFAALWNDLPIDDLRIADRLGVTRQQVINLRKSARERLARRMKGNIGVRANS